MISAAKSRAKVARVPFNLEPEDLTLPEICPALGLPLCSGTGVAHDASPQLDRLVPKLGYVRGNVCVISKKANTIKSNATPAELRAVADWYERAILAATKG